MYSTLPASLHLIPISWQSWLLHKSKHKAKRKPYILSSFRFFLIFLLADINVLFFVNSRLKSSFLISKNTAFPNSVSLFLQIFQKNTLKVSTSEQEKHVCIFPPLSLWGIDPWSNSAVFMNNVVGDYRNCNSQVIEHNTTLRMHPLSPT